MRGSNKLQLTDSNKEKWCLNGVNLITNHYSRCEQLFKNAAGRFAVQVSDTTMLIRIPTVCPQNNTTHVTVLVKL